MTGTSGASGPAYTGNVLTCNNGTWTGSPTSYTYVWRSNGTPIAGQTAQTYTVTSATEGTPLTCTVAATNANGTAAAVASSNTMQMWTPAQLGSSTTALWLDASDSSTITQSGGTVSQWRDKSGGVNHATNGTVAQQPLYNATGFNGRPTLGFSGAQRLIAQNAPSLNPENYTIFGVVAHDTTDVTSFRAWLEKAQDTSSGQRKYWMDVSGSPTWAPQGGTGAVDSENNTIRAIGEVTQSPQVVTFLKPASGGTAVLFQNGASKATDNTYSSVTNNTSNLGIGGLFYPWIGRVSEVILIGSALSDTNRQGLEGYLAHKWGLSGNLPADHPYKTNPPMVP